MKRESIEAVQSVLSRRGFLRLAAAGAGLGAVFDRFGDRLFGAAGDIGIARQVMSAMGAVVIPADEDPGWVTFDPGITDYALNVFIKQVLFGGNQTAFDGVLGTFAAFNETPVVVSYGNRFLNMSNEFRAQYFGDALLGQFEKDGMQDLLTIAAGLGMFAAKAVFFSNYPNHLAVPGDEYQTRPPSAVKTGWQIMNFKGPIGPSEEESLRARYMNVPVIPGVDPRNPYI